MPARIVIGAQWGDEGKGKIVDLLASQADVVARYQGGANAGHTICHGDTKYILHLIPSGILHDGVICAIGNGVVVDPVALFEEIEMLAKAGVTTAGRLVISPHAHVIFPYHKQLDKAKENYLGQNQVGTTQRGIGPAYLDKIDRCGIRMIDLIDSSSLKEKLTQNLAEKNKMLKTFGADELPVESMIESFTRMGELIKPLIGDVSTLLYKMIKEDKEVLIEGAQGTLLDIDHGTYPFVTSSNSSSGGACTGLGLSPTSISHVMGVVKAYTTRVGNGPFPTEFDEQFGKRVRELGGEFGATTGRPRRCGWLDLVQLKHAMIVNGIDELAITKLDVLDTIEQLKVCTEYKLDGRKTDHGITDAKQLQRVEPIYDTMDGWMSDTTGSKNFAELPQKAQAYLKFIEDYLSDAKIKIVSIGQERERTFMM